MNANCIFCDIAAGRAPASLIHEVEIVTSFMALHPSAPGECLVIPRAHVDHFTDLDDATAQRVMLVAQRIGRRMRTVFKPLRVGMMVHGFGMPHAHLIVVPQHSADQITSSRFARIENGAIVYDTRNVREPDRALLDGQALLLRDS